MNSSDAQKPFTNKVGNLVDRDKSCGKPVDPELRTQHVLRFSYISSKNGCFALLFVIGPAIRTIASFQASVSPSCRGVTRSC